MTEPAPYSYHSEGLSLRVEDSDTYQLVAAVRELEAHLLHEQACRLADVRAMVVELYQRDGVAVDDALLDAQAEDVDAQERAERFLGELATRIHPDAELLALAGQLDDRDLGVWRDAAASLVEACPPCLLPWRGGSRRSSARSCTATRTWSGPKPTSAAACAASAWRAGYGIVAGSAGCAGSWRPAARCGSGRRRGWHSWTPSCW